MRRIGIFVLVLLILVTVPAVQGVMDHGKDAAVDGGKSGRWIAHTTDEKDIADFQAKGCRVVHRLEDATAIACPPGVEKRLARIEEDRVFYIMDIAADIQINADDVWTLGYDGTGVRVAVLDTGVDTDHPELQGHIAGGMSFVSGVTGYEDDNGHGTHVTGIITATGSPDSTARGVAPGAEIWMGKVCNAQGSCYTTDIARAIEYVSSHQTETGRVMSISIGGGGTTLPNCDRDYLAQKVNAAVGKGVTVVAAAGNNGRSVTSPGCASKAIAVGAVDGNDVLAYFSGRGLALDIVAPGVSIYSTIPGDSYARYSGTSMATPHVTGTIALMLDRNPGLTDSMIKDKLYKTAKDLGTKGWDRLYGNGRVDALAAVNAVSTP